MAGKEGKLKSPIRKYLLLCSTENNSNPPESKLSFHLLILTSADVQLCLVPGQVCLSALWNSAQLLPSRNGYPGTGAPQGGDAVCPELQGLLREYEEISQREMKWGHPTLSMGWQLLCVPLCQSFAWLRTRLSTFWKTLLPFIWHHLSILLPAGCGKDVSKTHLPGRAGPHRSPGTLSPGTHPLCWWSLTAARHKKMVSSGSLHPRTHPKTHLKTWAHGKWCNPLGHKGESASVYRLVPKAGTDRQGSGDTQEACGSYLPPLPLLVSEWLNICPMQMGLIAAPVRGEVPALLSGTDTPFPSR